MTDAAQTISVVASSGREGISKVMQERPDVVLLDLMLPGLNGLEVCRELRGRIDTPIIMVTARGEEADRVMGLEGGAAIDADPVLAEELGRDA